MNGYAKAEATARFREKELFGKSVEKFNHMRDCPNGTIGCNYLMTPFCKMMFAYSADSPEETTA